MTKSEMLKICDKLDLYVSPNLKKEETSRRIAREILDNPIAVLYSLNKSELQLLKKLVEADKNKYIKVKAKATFNKLQRFGLVLTYIDEEKGNWYILMPDEVKASLAKYYEHYLKCAEEGHKGPSPREIRFYGFMQSFLEGEE